MRLLVTGGTGFVMSHVLRGWLEDRPDATAVCVDIAPPDAMAERFFAPVRDRLDVVTGDVRDPELLSSVPGREAISHVVCGAAMTPTVGTTERTRAAETVGVNMMGPVHCLEFARRLPRLERMVHVGTGSVYGDRGPDGGAPLPEEGYVRPFPTTLYPISKLAGELLARRWKELFGLPLHVARLSSVYGPMDRPTPGRDFVCAPNAMLRKALRGECWTVAGADAVGDFIHAGDVGRAIRGLLAAEAPAHDVYNIAGGRAVTLAELSDLVRSVAPDGSWREADDGEEADVVGDPARRAGVWGAYDISRIRADVGWAPRPLRAGLADYAAWLRENGAIGR